MGMATIVLCYANGIKSIFINAVEGVIVRATRRLYTTGFTV
jgi:hypothetical protein